MTKDTEILDKARLLSEKMTGLFFPLESVERVKEIANRLLPLILGDVLDIRGNRWTVIRWGAYEFIYPSIGPREALLSFGTAQNMTPDDMLKSASAKALKIWHFVEGGGLMVQANKSVEYEGALGIGEILFDERTA